VSLRLYETLAEQAAVALERSRLLEASQQQAWREHHIRDISDRITSSFDLDQLVRTTVEELGMMIGAAGGYVEMAPASVRGPGTAASSGRGPNGREEEEGT
jgi:GAF domain-containing protein